MNAKTDKKPKTCGDVLHFGLHTMVCEKPKGDEHGDEHAGEGFTWSAEK